MSFYSKAFSLHRFTGMLVSLLFLMWFISGLVLIYVPFPRVGYKMRYEKQENLPQNLVNIDSILAKYEKTASVKRVFQQRGQTLYIVKSGKKIDTVTVDNSPVLKPNIQQIAKLWVNAPIEKIDTLHEREQWIMYSSYKSMMPIYKFYFDDSEHHQLYIASKTGRVLQLTSRSQRIGAWFGPIPHMLYFPFLRKHTRVWINTLTVLGAIAFISVLLGMYVGLKLYFRKTKKIKFGSPYKKNGWYFWHHIAGLVFGIFLLTWSFSGAMSLQRIPQWAVKTHHKYGSAQRKVLNKALPMQEYKLDYRQIIAKLPNVKEIHWSQFAKIPIYEIISGDSSMYFDASNEKLINLQIPKNTIDNTIGKIHGDSASYTVELMQKYDNYYMLLSNRRPLPVYKVVVADKDNSTYYINPKTGDYRYINNSRRARKWVFSALHYFNIPFFAGKKVLWTIIIWALCLGGIVVSGSGVYLSWKYLKRKFVRTKRKYKRK